MDPNTFTTSYLKEYLKKYGLLTTGTKAELITRLDLAFPNGAWVEEALRDVEAAEDVNTEATASALATNNIASGDSQASGSHSNFTIEMLRQEQILMHRELDLLRRENELMRNSTRSVLTATTPSVDKPFVSLKFLGDLLSDFDGVTGIFEIWEKQLRSIRTAYSLDENASKALIGSKLKDKALRWLQSKPAHIELCCEELLAEMKKMFNFRPSKLRLKKKFEERRWQVSERYAEYHHDKLVLANQATIDEDDLIEYLIDGIPDVNLRDQARMNRFDSVSSMFMAFENISLRKDAHKSERFSDKSSGARKSVPTTQPGRCFNCHEQGHYTKSCPKPKREWGSCFNCGVMGHAWRDCPKGKSKIVKEGAVARSTPTTMALIDVPPESKESTSIRADNIEYEVLSDASNDIYCIFMAEANEKAFNIKALVDSGSAINVMSETIYKTSFSDYTFVDDKNNKRYGGVNKSLLNIYGYIRPTIRLQTLSDHVFSVRFAVVPDSTMSYNVILGREFLLMPGIEVTLSRTLNIAYREPNSDIMNIELIEENTELDLVHEDLDDSLPIQAKNKLIRLLKDYKNSNCDMPNSIDYEFHIRLADNSKPFHFSPRRLSWSERQEVKTIVKDLLERNVIRTSKSEFSSPIVLVRKRDDTHRMCVDYRALNKITIKDRYPLPLVEDQIDRLSGNRYFSSLDLKDGFHHVTVAEDSIKYTAFVTPDGHYEYCKMPFGLANAPAAFQRYINLAFRPLIEDGKVLIYFDDILIPSASLENHLATLEEVLLLLSKHQLKLNFSKCKFLKRKIDYLGYSVSEEGVTPNKTNVQAIQDFPRPTNAKQVQRFLGLASYFRKFVPDFALIAKPLYECMKKDVQFRFGERELRAFETIRNKLISYPVLAIYNPLAVTELHTDASAQGYGGILLQKQKDNRMHPVMYFSKRTTEVESRYHSYELEMLAIIYALQRFRVYLQGVPFTIITDCSAIKLALSKKDINPRISRWSLVLQEYDYKIEHRTSERMRHVDALSRNILVIEPLSFDEILVYKQLQDSVIKRIHRELEVSESEKFELRNGVVYRKWNKQLLFFVPESMISEVIRICHDEVGHIGLEKTMDLIMKSYWFPGMRQLVKDHIGSCIRCLTFAIPSGRKEGELHLYDKGTKPFETLHVDFFGPLEKSTAGFKHIFITIDAFTKFCLMYPVKSTSTKDAIMSLKKYFNHFGTFRRLVSDRGTAFTSTEFANFLSQHKIEHVKTATASPQSNGQVERVNRYLKIVLSKLSVDVSWVEALHRVQFTFNNTYNKSIDTTPSKLLFGVTQKGFVDDELRSYFENLQTSDVDRDELRDNAIDKIREMQLSNKIRYDKRHKSPNSYNVGDYVMVKNVVTTPGINQKLLPKYKGPYEVKKVLDFDRYVIGDIEGFPLSNKPFTGVFAPDRIKSWIKNVKSNSDSEEKE